MSLCCFLKSQDVGKACMKQEDSALLFPLCVNQICAIYHWGLNQVPFREAQVQKVRNLTEGTRLSTRLGRVRKWLDSMTLNGFSSQFSKDSVVLGWRSAYFPLLEPAAPRGSAESY